MGVFNNNITNEISKNEKIRFWFMQRIIEQFACYTKNYSDPDRQWMIYNDLYHIVDLIHKDLVFLWTNQYKSYLEWMGVYSTMTDVSRKIGKNRFKVEVRFCTDPDFKFVLNKQYTYESVTIENLKI